MSNDITAHGSATPVSVYILADNLDTALAAGEDLLKTSLTWQAGDERSSEALAEQRALERRAVEDLRSLEMVLVARVMKSRESAVELARSEAHLKPIARLYGAGTALLADAVTELGDGIHREFDAGDTITAYIRSRGLLAEDDAAPLDAETLQVTEEFRVCGRVGLGVLMDLVAEMLDTLDRHYDLYAADAVPGARPTLADKAVEANA